ncbi:MAG: hypothetical protein FWE91_12625 [Defluviitaleaceae bacterium]|nr:hypothetical protein [Defluviitaleaceae bacterium]MCL2837350.1 hypothetical protein [Defluviitaleaceae bacterium]
MYDAYIARTAEGMVYAFYYSPGNGLCQRVHANNRWGAALSVAVDARPGFTVSMRPDGRFYVLYRDTEGAARLMAGGRDGYTPVALENDFEGEASVIVSDKGRLFLTEESIGGLERMPECAFRVQIVKDDHAMVFYNTPKTDANFGFGYKELNFIRQADFRPIHMGAGVTRFSALTTDTNVHFLYVARNMLGSRLLYRRKHKAGLSAAVTVCEGSRFDGCWLFIMKNRIHAAYMISGSLYISVSDDDGQVFRRPAKYRNKLCESPVKAAYLTHTPPDEDGLVVREVYVDSLNPWDVQIIPELYPEFFPEPEVKAPPPQPVLYQPPVANHDNYSSVDGWYGVDMPESDKLRNQIEGLERQIAGKDRQLAALKQEIETQRAVIEKMFTEKT